MLLHCCVTSERALLLGLSGPGLIGSVSEFLEIASHARCSPFQVTWLKHTNRSESWSVPCDPREWGEKQER